MLTALYGSESPQLKQFQTGFAAIQKTAGGPGTEDIFVYQHAHGVILRANGSGKERECRFN
jgi:hypothetical protein